MDNHACPLTMNEFLCQQYVTVQETRTDRIARGTSRKGMGTFQQLDTLYFSGNLRPRAWPSFRSKFCECEVGVEIELSISEYFSSACKTHKTRNLEHLLFSFPGFKFWLHG